MVGAILLEFKILITDVKKIIKNPKSIIIWILILPFVFLSIVLIYIFSLIFYINFLFNFLYKSIKKKIYKYKKIKKYIKPIKIEKTKIVIKNDVIRDLYNLVVTKSQKKAFFYLYFQILIVKETKKNKKDFFIILKKFFELFLFFIFRRVVFFITSLPYIVIKNNNKITLLIKNIIEISADSKKEYLYIILLNLKIRYLTEINEQTKNKKIIFNKNKIKLNPSKKIYNEAINLLKKFNEPKLYYDSLQIFSEEMIYFNVEIKYVENNEIKFTKGHPTGVLYKKDNSEDTKILAINETTQEKLKYNFNLYKDLNIKSKPFFEKPTKKEIAYKTTVYEVEKELLKLKNNNYINNEFEKPENKIKKLIFIQGFFLNLNSEMFKFDINNKLIIDKKYLNLQDYFEKNIEKFDDNKKKAIEKMLEFYNKNKDNFKNENDNFLNLINKSTIDKETKEFFLKIINKS